MLFVIVIPHKIIIVFFNNYFVRRRNKEVKDIKDICACLVLKFCSVLQKVFLVTGRKILFDLKLLNSNHSEIPAQPSTILRADL